MAAPEKRPDRIKTLAWLLFAGWLVGITILSSLPGSAIKAPAFPGADKVAHFLMFAAGACPLVVALRRSARRSPVSAAGTALAIMLLVAAADELHQRFTPGRSGADVGDIIADAIGAACGIAGTIFVYGKRRPPAPLGTPGTPRPDPAA